LVRRNWLLICNLKRCTSFFRRLPHWQRPYCRLAYYFLFFFLICYDHIFLRFSTIFGKKWRFFKKRCYNQNVA
jgi:hypothetical protein